MEELVENSKSVPLTKTRAVNYDEFFILSAQLRGALPEDIKKAEKLARDGQQMMDTARAEAQRTVSKAQSEAQVTLDDAKSQSERLISESRTRADRVLEDARREAERIIADAQQHAEQLVAEHTITSRAEELADQIEQAALQESDHLRQQADNYAYDILDRAETVMQKLLVGLEQGKTQISAQPRAEEYTQDPNEANDQNIAEGTTDAD